MGTKLNVLIIAILAGCMFGCKTNNAATSSDEAGYVIAYKKAVLFGCLNESTERGFSKLLTATNDLGNYAEAQILFHSVYEDAKTIGINHAKLLEPVSYPDAENKIPGYSSCVSYAFSKEVDSIARLAYAIRLKNPN